MKESEKFDVNGIKGIVHYKSNKFIICCHGLFSSKDSRKYMEIAEIANEKGISCMRFDFRGCGESDGKFSYKLEDRLKDLEEVMKYLARRYGSIKCALFGSSLGGMVAIKYAANREISSLAILATPYKFEIDNYVADITAEIEKCSHLLVMHGLKDELVPYKHAELIYRKAKEPKKILFFNTNHSFTDENERRRAINEAVKWIEKYFV